MKSFSLSDNFFTHSKLAQELFLDSVLYKNAKTVCAFCSMNDEIQTAYILEQTLIRKKLLALPKVEDDFFQKDQADTKNLENAKQDTTQNLLQNLRMNFYFVENLNHLKKNKWGIYEPDTNFCKYANANDFSNAVFLVPGVAFSKNGARLGRGKGFYDSFLNDVRRVHFTTPVVGFCFDWQVLNSVPTQEHDQKMTHLATESGVVSVVC